ncbi:MAG: hypothetical protein CSA62_00325 [Planctomycetota bacterium]|nr:MAG: hypothetical protein CSA62_00325 [Planctomycetota bacterium]
MLSRNPAPCAWALAGAPCFQFWQAFEKGCLNELLACEGQGVGVLLRGILLRGILLRGILLRGILLRYVLPCG